MQIVQLLLDPGSVPANDAPPAAAFLSSLRFCLLQLGGNRSACNFCLRMAQSQTARRWDLATNGTICKIGSRERNDEPPLLAVFSASTTDPDLMLAIDGWTA